MESMQPSANKKAAVLPSLHVSQNIKKAIEKNVGYEEELIRTLQDVNIKKQAALNEMNLKKEAFLKKQRLRRESLPDVLLRGNRTKQPLVIDRRESDDLQQCCTKAHSFPSCRADKTITQRTEKLPSLPGITTESGEENDKDSSEVSDSKGFSEMKSKKKQLCEADSVRLITERNPATKSTSGKVPRAQSWPPSPSIHLKKPLLNRRKSVADLEQAHNNAGSIWEPTWLRRQTLHHIFHSTNTLRASETRTNIGISDPSAKERNTNITLSIALGEQSRYRKVLNRRRTLQARTLYQSGCFNGRLGANHGGERNSKSLEEFHVLSSMNKNQRCRRVSFQE